MATLMPMKEGGELREDVACTKATNSSRK